jgi:hypothetical protein
MTTLLNSIQSNLEKIYEVAVPQNVLDFVITDRRFAELVSNNRIHDDALEQLLIATNDGCLDISLYLDETLINRLGDDYPSQHTDKNDLHDFWIALEGVSHFLYLVWNASYDRPVSQLELELQAEVDKFVSVTSAIPAEKGPENMREIWSLLFSKPTFKDNLEQENLLRYQKANAYASQYCINLMEMQNTTTNSMKNELRRFYRLSQQEKISCIDNFGLTKAP